MAGKYRTLDPGYSWDADLPLPQGKVHDNVIYVSGQVAYAPDGTLVGENDMTAQTRQVYENIKTILALEGASFDDVIKITTFVTDMSRVFEVLAVRREIFGDKAHHPASSTVGVTALVYPELLVEVEAIAIKS